MYEFGFGHIVLYPLGVFALSAIFFGWGYRVGRRRERSGMDGQAPWVGR